MARGKPPHPPHTNPFCSGRAGAGASAASEKVRTRLEELDDFEEVSTPPAAPPGSRPACVGPGFQRRLFSRVPEQAPGRVGTGSLDAPGAARGRGWPARALRTLTWPACACRKRDSLADS